MIDPRRKRRPWGAPLDHDPEAVRIAREERGLTKRAVAHQCGFSEQLMCDIEAGRRNATPQKLAMLAFLLGRSEADLRAKPEPEPTGRAEQ
ncbi:helix-turn-helix domain-containing protein [Streptomyces sp. DH12]|uniref:helix-turn-helix domain-containing protein n=1 Tax=Streptomyces sp. DH12 TaxID=2857010 RepID=UPI001E42DF71|nr:helix-turn-helix transcriptional regulator [Streptomyces sp. DH12]